MATETIYATTVGAGNCTNAANALGAPDGTFTTDTGNTNWTQRWNLGAPTETDLAQVPQSFVVTLRKDSTNSGNPDLTSFVIYVDGVQVSSGGPTTVTSSTSTTATYNWTPAANTSSQNVEVEIVSTSAGGNPSTRNALQVDAITWTAQTAAGPANQPPVADAGVDQTVETNTSVTLDGTASSDPDGSIASYSWNQTSGPLMIWDGGTNSATATFTTSDTAGTYVFELTVTDNDGATDTDTVTINALEPAANQPPVANAGANEIGFVAEQIVLDGSASSDPDGTISSYSWVQTSGPAVSLTGSGATRTFTTSSPGSYTFELTVTDNDGATSTDSVTITVQVTIYLFDGVNLIPMGKPRKRNN